MKGVREGARVEGAGDGERAGLEDVSVDHGGGDVLVAEQLLHSADVAALFQQMRGEGVTQGVATRALGDSGSQKRAVDGPLDDGFMKVMPAPLAGFLVEIDTRRREDPLPSGVPAGVGVLSCESVVELDPACSPAQVRLMLLERLRHLSP